MGSPGREILGKELKLGPQVQVTLPTSKKRRGNWRLFGHQEKARERKKSVGLATEDGKNRWSAAPGYQWTFAEDRGLDAARWDGKWEQKTGVKKKRLLPE